MPSDIKDILWRTFQEKLESFYQKRNRFKAELANDLNELEAAYGADALRTVDSELDPLLVLERVEPETKPGKKRRRRARQAPQLAETEPQPKHRRKRKPRVEGEPSITEILLDLVPKAIAARDMVEFTSNDMYEQLRSGFNISSRINVGHVSLFLCKRYRKLKLKRIQRAENGRRANFYSKK